MSNTSRINFLKRLEAEWDGKSDEKALTFINDYNQNVRLFALGLLHKNKSFLLHIAAQTALTDSSILMRNTAAEILGEIGDSRDIYRLKISANDPEWSVRCSVASSLAKFGRKAEKTLIRLVYQDSNPHVRRYAAVALADINDSNVMGILEGKLSNEKNPNAQVGLIYALYKYGQHNRLSELLELLNTTDYHIKNQILDCLQDTRIEDAPAIIATISCLREGDQPRSIKTKSAETLKILST